MRNLIRQILAASLIAVVGCNAPGERSHENGPLSYPAARAYDFLDILEVNVGAGVGLQAAVEITPIRIGYGYYDTAKFGTMGRSVGIWDEDRREFWFGHTFLFWQKNPCFGNAYLFEPDELHRMNKKRSADDHSRVRFYEKWCWTTRYEDWERPWLDCVLEAHALFLGAEVAVSPQELADFVLGLFMIDTISHDDWVGVPHQAEPAAGDPPPSDPGPPADSSSP